MENFEDIDDLIAKALTGEADERELALLETWKNESADHAEYFEQSKKLFREIDNLNINYPVNADAAWQKLDLRIGSQQTKIISIFNRRTLIRAAASVVLLVALGFVVKWLLNPKETQTLQYAAANKAVSDTLPDGSRIFMNKHSEISYTVNHDNIRQVKLRGEAFFEVVHNEKQPFEVIINDVIIKDIGTAFNVKALPGTNTIEVSVESGEVQFYTAADTGLSLFKGETAVYSLATKRFVKSFSNPTENVTSYRSKVFRFNKTPLEEVIRQINNVYDSNINLIGKQVSDKKLSVMFNNEPLDTILVIIAETLDLDIEKTDSMVILKNKPKMQ